MKIGIVGAGVMGSGIAHAFAQSGHEVILVDVAQAALNNARQSIYENVRLQLLYNKPADLLTPEDVLARIRFSLNNEDLREADFLIENAPEKWTIKQAIYEQVDRICQEHCIFMVNTSCMSITKIAGLTGRPNRIIGVHFMNPVPLKPTVEVIRGFHTSDETERAVNSLLQSIGKESIVVNDLPGFVSNRVSHLFMNEAAFVVQDQVATPDQVDAIFKKCFGHKMGPLETADLIGLDTVVDSLDVLYESYQDPKFRCCPLLRKMVAANLLGRKTGRGFYTYSVGGLQS